MKKAFINRAIQFWEKGFLYITVAFLMYLVWLFSDNVGILDWIKEISYFEYFKTSFNDYHTLPYFWWNILEEVAWRPPIPGSSAIIANPETALFSPLTPLLCLLSTQTYIKLYIVVQFLIGVFGLTALKRKLNWNNLQFRTFSVLFLFTPIIIQHLSVAYFTWYNFYLFPWFIYFVADRRTSVGVVGTSAVLGLIVLQGGIYIVQYIGLLYVLYELFLILIEKRRDRILRTILVPLFAVMLAFVRIYLTAGAYGGYARPWVEIDGYNIPFFLFYALIPTVTIPPLDLFFHSDFLGWSLTPHDSGQFWGLSIIMLVFLVIRYKKIVKASPIEQQNNLNFNAIFFASAVLFTIAFYQIWYFIMRAVSVLNLPLFESIKNHGIRFIMGAYFGIAIVLANFSNQIWDEFDIILSGHIWKAIKKVLVRLYQVVLLGMGLLILIFTVFKRYFYSIIEDIITKAYYHTDHIWLHKRMEGIDSNDLEFYFYRFNHLCSSILNWMLIIFFVLIIFWALAFFINKNKSKYVPIVKQFPHIKYELLLAIPLIFSTFMWMNLATSVPFNKYPVEKVLVPDITTLPTSEENLPLVEATPMKLIIKPTSETTADGYVFEQIPASDYKHFEIITKNAVLFDKRGKLMLKPLDNEPIEMQFRTGGVKKALTFTIISWTFILCFAFKYLIINRKRRIENE